ncbi:MAG: beta-galactosidase [Clostridia bacterium]|nr:beta-galactosidase [Clostridia bacterium]
MTIPRPEYPNPQFERADWINLNGTWAFETDPGRSGEARKVYAAEKLAGEILVPFCPESKLSGVGHTDFMPAVWYRRTVEIPADKLAGRVFLHFGAVDYRAVVYVNGACVGEHKGGYVHFSFDVTGHVHAGENVIAVYAEDDARDGLIPSGKQCFAYASQGCHYTRTTGIWQTVWLEFTPKAYIKSVKLYPDAANGSVQFTAEVCGAGTFRAEAFFDGTPVGSAQSVSSGETVCGTIALSQVHLWDVGQGNLYDLTLRFGDDTVKSYFGLRSVGLDDKRFLLNGRSVFMRLVLDQGFYPDGIYTARDEDALVRDIELSLAAGFNGARLHEKVFEPRFLYHCDRMGYLVWGEYPNWGLDYSDPRAAAAVIPEWLEAVGRDFNHPAIIGWCPFNETWDYDGRIQWNELLRMVYRVTKAVDPTRPCIDTSGNFHVETDIYDTHDYEQSVDVFTARYQKLTDENELFDLHHDHGDAQIWCGEPVFISEYGGIRWAGEDAAGWGYGEAPKTEEEYKQRYKGLTDVLLDNPRMCGFCYTQLYDVEQELNGLYTYDREPKFNMDFFHAVNSRKAAIEE